MKRTAQQSLALHKAPILRMVLTLVIGFAFVASIPVLSWLAIRENNREARHTQAQGTTAVNATPPHNDVRRFTVKVEENTVTSGLPITINYGDKVFIAIEIGEQDEAEFQIPGLLQSTTVEHGGVKHFEFTADKRGTHDVIMANEEPWEGEMFSQVVGKLYVY